MAAIVHLEVVQTGHLEFVGGRFQVAPGHCKDKSSDVCPRSEKGSYSTTAARDSILDAIRVEDPAGFTSEARGENSSATNRAIEATPPLAIPKKLKSPGEYQAGATAKVIST